MEMDEDEGERRRRWGIDDKGEWVWLCKRGDEKRGKELERIRRALKKNDNWKRGMRYISNNSIYVYTQ